MPMCCSVLIDTIPTHSSSIVAMSSCCPDIAISHSIQRLVMQCHRSLMPKSGVALFSGTFTVISISGAITPTSCAETTEANKGGKTYGQSDRQVALTARKGLNDSDVHKPSGLLSA